MSVYVEYELRCDCGGERDPFGCEPAIYANNAERAWREAAEDGWVRRRDGSGAYKHYRRGHEPRR
jgi:hypothetical protein